ncbi:n-acetylglucosaminyltransferase II (MGAT2) domain-containing protein [Phthorimaea operculella]|nr:n-acetylglucosaminyltransferase II (MGAT2) domain-containing protein [Phthorimaea operculella]
MAISVPVTYWRALLKKIRRNLKRSERVCELHLCSPSQYEQYPYYKIVSVRNILFVLVLLLLLIFCRGIRQQEKDELEDVLPLDSLLYVKFVEKKYPDLNIADMKQLMHQYNKNETILNERTFDCSAKWDEVILVVMVKELTESFKFLLTSLSQVREIESVLLIFSHSYYDENLNELIRDVNFCRVQQIFYPYSLQVNPNTFPGFDPNDCPYEMNVQQAKKLNCTGVKTPDVNGLFRHPEKAEKKHHWWWTANKVFEDLKFYKTVDTFVVFLEANLYIMEDFLHTLKYMKGVMRVNTNCDFISLSSPTADLELFRKKRANHLDVQFFDPVNHSSVLGFDLFTWKQIVSRYDLFCDVDDYSWSNSLFHMSKEVVGDEKNNFEVLSSTLPRAYNLDAESGILTDNRQQVHAKAYEIIKMQNEIKDDLFPWEFEFHYEYDSEKIHDRNDDIYNGGWSDPRDKKLCSDMTLREKQKDIF